MLIIIVGLFFNVFIQFLFNFFKYYVGINGPIVIMIFKWFSTWKFKLFSWVKTLQQLDNPFFNSLISFCLIDILSISLIFFTIRRKDLI